MGEVLIFFQVMPEGTDTDLKPIKTALEAVAKACLGVGVGDIATALPALPAATK